MTSALVLGSVLPDIDIVLVPTGFDRYLYAHAAGTHAVAGTIVGAVLLAAVLRRLVKGSRFLILLIAGWAGTAGHVLADLADGSDIGVFEPLSPSVFGWHLFSMGDPFVLCGLAVAALAAMRPRHSRRVAIGAVAALLAFAWAKQESQQKAFAWYVASMKPNAGDRIEIAPQVGVFDWMIYDRAGDEVRGWNINARTGGLSLAFQLHDAADEHAAALSRQFPVVRAFLALSTLPFARVDSDGSHRLILWSDARRCSAAGCDVSFGGAFDGANVPLYQVIRVGGFTETRPLPSLRLPPR